MATKRCSYKGCRSIHMPDVPCSETFFQFPKDETRYEVWMALSRCEDKSTKGVKYLCSKHFDHNKYMSMNPRRKLLLTTAIPYAYQSDNEDNSEEVEEERLQDVVSTQYEDEDYFSGREVIVEEPTDQVLKEDQDDIVLEYPESTEEIAQVEVVDDSDYDKSLQNHPNILKEGKLENLNNYCKRKIEENYSADGKSFKRLQIRHPKNENKISPRIEVSITRELSLNESKTAKHRKMDLTEQELIMDPSVTTFIFKGEEYVQMPKKLYLDEKLELLRELQYYKDIVTNFKNLVDNIKI